MIDEEKHFDEDLDLKVGSKLSADLKALFTPELSVPPEVDRAITDQVHRRLIRRHRPLRLFRWAASVAAAAAVIIFVFMLESTIKEPSPTFDRSMQERDRILSRAGRVVIQADIDHNGRVDILDAFKLARHIKSADRPDIKLDINGDGLVNRSDVDSVAFAAVRLDKGVL